MSFCPEPHSTVLQKLCPELKEILDAEIAAGNAICDTHDGWGRDSIVLVSLKRPFRVKGKTLPPGVVHHQVNDPHWWKEEYVHQPTGHLLVCRFDS